MKRTVWTQGKWEFRRLGDSNYIEISYVGSTDRGIPLTGADVKTQLQIPFPHRILNLQLYHTTSAYVDSTTKYTLQFGRLVGSIPVLEHAGVTLWHQPDIPAVSKIVAFGENENMSVSSVYTLTLNGTATDIIFPLITVQQLGDFE